MPYKSSFSKKKVYMEEKKTLANIKILTYLLLFLNFSKSLNEGEILQDWEGANITQLHKKKKSSLPATIDQLV